MSGHVDCAWFHCFVVLFYSFWFPPYAAAHGHRGLCARALRSAASRPVDIRHRPHPRLAVVY
eukprot:263727-Pleurochrysis_carterae.AAC.2